MKRIVFSWKNYSPSNLPIRNYRGFVCVVSVSALQALLDALA
eukprot:COSAG06_NODE_46281_length_348_cov_0.626506_1_plen_41_part_01